MNRRHTEQPRRDNGARIRLDRRAARHAKRAFAFMQGV